MKSDIEFKLKRLYEGRKLIFDQEIPEIEMKHIIGTTNRVSYDNLMPEESIANFIYLHIANIASLKDHLKKWCQQSRLKFKGDKLINNNKDVAIIHDLWNIDKHYNLDRESRSGLHPFLLNISRSLYVSSIDGGNDTSIENLIDTLTGKVLLKPGPNTKIEFIINADVMDRDQNHLGELKDIQARAIDAWLELFDEAGISISRT